MISTPCVLLEPGTSVRTTQLNEAMVDEWTTDGLESKRWGVDGVIVAHHDSHGLCYDIRHEDGSLGCYDPSEFQVTEAKV